MVGTYRGSRFLPLGTRVPVPGGTAARQPVPRQMHCTWYPGTHHTISIALQSYHFFYYYNCTENIIINNELNIYLNNSSEHIILQNKNNLNITNLEIFNTLGQRLKEWKNTENNLTSKFDVSNLSSTVYIVKVKTDKGVFTKKIIKQ